MPHNTRRTFLQSAAACAAAAMLPQRAAHATPFDLPLGLQLYSVRDQLKQNYASTLREVGKLGYKQVEAAGFFGHQPADVNAAMDAAELHLVSAHYSASELLQHFDLILNYQKQLKQAHYLICAFPAFAPGHKAAHLPFKQQVTSFTLEDWKWNARQFNKWGKQAKAAGLQFGYHNHTMEFQPQNGVIPYDLLLKETDPELVIMELDCGWVTVGGGSPEAYLRKYPERIKMLHVKDFARDPGHSSVDNPPPAAELGRGTSDYKKIFAAVKPGSLKHIFVEQEAYPDMPWKQALKVDADYLKALKT